jgi:hypothetical protein
MESAAPCPSLEDLAAFLDGRLPAERRAEIVAHLASCEECFEVFAGAAGSLDETLGIEDDALVVEEPAGSPGTVHPFFEPPAPSDGRLTVAGAPGAPSAPRRGRLPARLPRRWRLAAAIAAPIAALLLAALGFFVLYRQNPADGLSSDWLTARLGQPAGDATPWGKRLRGGPGDEASTAPLALESFQLGVPQLDLRLALAAGDLDSADAASTRMARALKQVDFLPPDTPAGYASLAATLGHLGTTLGPQNGVKRRADLRFLLPAADNLEKKGFLEDAIDPEFAALGRWTETCRLSADAGRDEIFRRRETRRLLDWMLAPDPEARAGSQGTAAAVPADGSTAASAPAPAASAEPTNADRLGVAEAPEILRDIRQRIASLPAGAKGAAPPRIGPIGAQCRNLLERLDPN